MSDDDPRSWRDAQAEAQAIAGEWARVLEPSPPAVNEEPWFADDPVDGIAIGERWAKWLAGHPEHQEWASARWLAGTRTSPAVPPTLAATRIDLHRLGAYVIAPLRHSVNGKFGLRWTFGGFGTPFFGDDRQVRVVGNELIDQNGAEVRTAPITTLRAAAEFLGGEIDPDTAAEHDSPELGDIDAPLTVHPTAVDFLGQWYGMAFAALEAVRADSASVDPSRPQLWPGHFDPAIEVGDEDHRGSYGASPGDESIAEPYLYVSLWWPDRIGFDADDPFWNAPSFKGAVLKLADFGPGDSVAAAAAFFRAARDHL